MSNEKLGKELKALGGEVAKAVIQMKNSNEFKKLQKDLAISLKFVAASLTKALKSAKDSDQTGKIKNRLKRVVKIGKKQGLSSARKAEITAAQKIRQARKAIKTMSKKIKS